MIDDDLDTPDRIASHVWEMVQACEQHSQEQKTDRDRALEYYDGKMTDVTREQGRSGVVSQDVRTGIKKVLPSVLRTLLSNDRVVEYEPVGPGDEDQADQATAYINSVVIRECGAEEAIHDALMDALTVKTGILKWTAYENREAKLYTYTDQPDDQLEQILTADGVELLEVDSRPETDPEVLQVYPDAQRHDIKLKRTTDQREIRLEAVPRGAFLIFPGAPSIKDSPVVGERLFLTRSDLITRGYDREAVDQLSAWDHTSLEETDHEARVGDDWTSNRASSTHAMEIVQLYEVYIRIDLDDDGIAELHKVCIAEQGDSHAGSHEILAMEEVDEAPYAEIVIERTAHEFEGRSIAEELIEIQRIKTALLRETLDNIYWQNRPQPVINPSKLTQAGIEAVFSPEFGLPIELAPGAQNIQEAVQWQQVPFVAQHSYQMMGYLDEEARDRTGVSDQSGGLDPEAFRAMSATQATIISESGLAQAEMMIRTVSRGGLRRAFKGLLGLVIAHTDQPRTIRLQGNWVTYDPRHWDSGMDCRVNTGLGAGSRDRDLQVLQMILGLQRELVQAIGADNPYVKPDQIYNTLTKIVEASGFPTSEPYFTKPDPQEVQAKMQEGQQPSIEQQALEAQMQLEQSKAQHQVQVEQAQMEADIKVKTMEAQLKMQLETAKAESDTRQTQMRAEIDLLKHREKLQLEYTKVALDATEAPDEPFQAGSLYDGI